MIRGQIRHIWLGSGGCRKLITICEKFAAVSQGTWQTGCVVWKISPYWLLRTTTFNCGFIYTVATECLMNINIKILLKRFLFVFHGHAFKYFYPPILLWCMCIILLQLLYYKLTFFLWTFKRSVYSVPIIIFWLVFSRTHNWSVVWLAFCWLFCEKWSHGGMRDSLCVWKINSLLHMQTCSIVAY